MRVFYLTTSQFALSNIALRRLKVARLNDLNDPFELLAIDVAAFDLRVGMSAKKRQIDLREGLMSQRRELHIPSSGLLRTANPARRWPNQSLLARHD